MFNSRDFFQVVIYSHFHNEHIRCFIIRRYLLTLLGLSNTWICIWTRTTRLMVRCCTCIDRQGSSRNTVGSGWRTVHQNDLPLKILNGFNDKNLRVFIFQEFRLVENNVDQNGGDLQGDYQIRLFNG
jgi:hypothetical protein